MSSPVARARALITPTGVFVALVPIAAAVILYYGRGTTFFVDDWQWIAGRRDWTLATFLHPHNQHLSLIPIAIYKLLFVTVGIGHYWPYRVAVVAVHVLCSVLVFVLVRRRLGGWEAVVAGGLILFLGSATDDLLWGFQIGFLLSIAFGLGAWMALERDDRAGDVVAAMCLGLALASASLGIPIAIGVGAELLRSGGLRQRRWWLLAAPVGLYVLWYAGYGHSGANYDLVEAPGWALDAAATAFAGPFGGRIDWGRPLLVLGVAIALAQVLRPGARISPRLVGLVVTGVSFWLVVGTTRWFIQAPWTPRYIYLGVVVIVLVACELSRDLARTQRVLVALGVLLAASAWLNLTPLRDAGRERRVAGDLTRVTLGAATLARAYMPASYPLVTTLGAPLIDAGQFFAAVDDLGSTPAAAAEAIAGSARGDRRRADLTLQRAGGIALALGAGGARGGPAPHSEAVVGGAVSTNGPCVVFAANATGAAVELVLTAARTELTGLDGITEVRARRWGDDYANPVLGAPANGGSATVTTQPDAVTLPWRLRLASTGRVRACSLL